MLPQIGEYRGLLQVMLYNTNNLDYNFVKDWVFILVFVCGSLLQSQSGCQIVPKIRLLAIKSFCK